jgi:hypothetical protein
MSGIHFRDADIMHPGANEQEVAEVRIKRCGIRKNIRIVYDLLCMFETVIGVNWREGGKAFPRECLDAFEEFGTS